LNAVDRPLSVDGTRMPVRTRVLSSPPSGRVASPSARRGIAVECDGEMSISRRSCLTVFAVLTTLLAVGPARGQVDLVAAADTVLAQLDAFRRDDYDTAYGFASEAIHRLFDRQRFERMVQGGYPEIARSRSARVARARAMGDGRAVLVVKIQGTSGHRIEAVYELVWEDGRWKIDGVVARPDGDVV